jgi:hypothetical protein
MSGGTLTRYREALIGGALVAVAAVLLASLLAGDPADAAKGGKGKGKYSITTKTFQISQPNNGQRLEVFCPGKSEPLGGGMITSPPAADGEGIYPHSYERLGQQSGYHISVILFDPSPSQTQARSVTLQVVCGPKYGKVQDPHQTLDLGPSDTKQAIAKCSGKRVLIGGGYQRTNFTHQGGIIATESHAISKKAWLVSAQGLGRFGGQATAIGYCVRSKKPLLREVTATTTVPPGGFATATTAACTGKRLLAFGGYATPGTGSILSTGGSFQNGAWSVSGYNTSSAPGTLTAHGYCLKTPPPRSTTAKG